MRCVLAAILLCLIALPAAAFDRHDPTNPWRQEMSAPSLYQKRAKKVRHERHVKARAKVRSTANTACLPYQIKAALEKVNQACGITVISTHRPGARIAGTGHPSMHAVCRAADFTTKNPPCVLQALADWRGKLSTDYHRVRHFHIDDGSYARFAHGGGRHARRHTRYARAGG
jgi:hypothetical protein